MDFGQLDLKMSGEEVFKPYLSPIHRWHNVHRSFFSVPTVYGLRQIDRLLPSAEGTAEGSRWKFLNLRQLAELRLLQNLLPFDSSFSFNSVEIMLKISKIEYYLSYFYWNCLLFSAKFMSLALILNYLLVPHSVILQKVLSLTEDSAFSSTYWIPTVIGRLLLYTAWQ